MRRWLIVFMLLFALVGAACGGGDDGDSVDTAADSAEDAGDEKSDTDFSGKGSGDFCQLAKDFTKKFEDQEFGDSAAETKKAFQEIRNATEELADKAPDEIEADVKVIEKAAQESDDFYAKYDYDPSKIPASEANTQIGFSRPEVEGASDRVESYLEKVCKIDSDEDGDTDGNIDDGSNSVPDDETTEAPPDETTETTTEE